mgnify:CR=1 FL=1
MLGLRSFIRRACFSIRAKASLEPISKHQDWESTVILEDDSGFFGPDIPLRRIEERGRTYLNQAKELSSHKSFEESNGLLDRAMDAFKSTFGEEYPEIYDVYKNKAKNFFRLKSWDQGIEWYQKAVEHSYKKLDNRSALLEYFIDRAWAHVERKEFDKAESFYKKIFDLIHNEEAKYHTQVLTALDDMAHMYHMKGDLNMALNYHYEALKRVDNLKVSDQPYKAKILTHIAQIHTELGDSGEALRCAKTALELYEKSAAIDDPAELSWCYNTIGEALNKEGNSSEADKYFEKAAELKNKIDKGDFFAEVGTKSFMEKTKKAGKVSKLDQDEFMD